MKNQGMWFKKKQIVAISVAGIAACLQGCGDEASFASQTVKRVSGTYEEPDPVTPLEPETEDATEIDVITDPVAPPDVVSPIDTGDPTVVDPPDPETPVIELPSTNLLWYWPCASEPAPEPTDVMTMVIEGPGHYAVPAGVDAISVEMAGLMCEPSDVPRDVVFVIDVSDSMRGFLNLGNDPLRNGSCGRNQAVTAVVDSLKANDRVAFVTFDGNVKRDSGGFVTVDQFRANYLTPDVFCESGANTNFQKGLAKAETFVNAARPVSNKEVYFISDGEPTSNNIGQAEAARIKEKGTIATLMLKGNDTILKGEIASRDQNGNPIHAKVDDAAALAGSLSALATSDLAYGAFYFGPLLDSQGWTTIPLDPKVSREFTLPKTEFTRGAYEDGLGFTFVYGDTRGIERRYSGTITFD